MTILARLPRCSVCEQEISEGSRIVIRIEAVVERVGGCGLYCDLLKVQEVDKKTVHETCATALNTP
jgi:hypothetical protein